MEVFIVYEAGGKKRRPIGFLTSVDGHLRRTSEVSYDGESTKPSVVRTVQRDEKGTVLDEVSADVRALPNPVSRLSQTDHSGAQQTFGRLMHGLASLVLPDQLHAASPRSAASATDDAGCFLLEIAAIAAAETVVIAGYAVAGFGVGCEFAVLPSCTAFLVALAAETTAIAAAATATHYWVECLNAAAAGNNGGGGGGTGSGSGGGAGSGSRLICKWKDIWYQDFTGTIVTESITVCHYT